MNAVLLAELKDRKHFTESRSKIVQSSGTNKKRKNPSAKKKKQTTRYFPRSESRFAGIQNQGSTCFLNSLLQMFYAIPEFRIALYSWHRDLKKDGNDEDCAGYQMRKSSSLPSFYPNTHTYIHTYIQNVFLRHWNVQKEVRCLHEV